MPKKPARNGNSEKLTISDLPKRKGRAIRNNSWINLNDLLKDKIKYPDGTTCFGTIRNLYFETIEFRADLQREAWVIIFSSTDFPDIQFRWLTSNQTTVDDFENNCRKGMECEVWLEESKYYNYDFL